MEVLTKYKEPVKGVEIEFGLADIDEIKRPPFQRDLSELLVQRLFISMEKLGFLHPIIVYEDETPNGEKALFVVDGQHRLEAARMLNVSEVPVLKIPKELALNIMEFNTEKPPNVREKAIQTYRLYNEFLNREPQLSESELADYIEEPHYITLGFVLEELSKKFPAGAFENLLKKIDAFLDSPLEEAVKERRRRAKKVYEVGETLNRVYEELGLTNALIKTELVRKAVQKVYGKRVRTIEDDFYTALEKVKKALEELKDEWPQQEGF